MNAELEELGVVEAGCPHTKAVVPATPLPASPEERMEYTQGVRMKLVDALAPFGDVPTDKDGVQMLLSTLKDMDGQELGKMRQRTDNLAAAKDQLVAQAIIELSKRQGVRGLRDERDVGSNRPKIPLDNELPDIQVVPGELDTGNHTMSYTEMAGRFSRANVPAIEQDK